VQAGHIHYKCFVVLGDFRITMNLPEERNLPNPESIPASYPWKNHM